MIIAEFGRDGGLVSTRITIVGNSYDIAQGQSGVLQNFIKYDLKQNNLSL